MTRLSTKSPRVSRRSLFGAPLVGLAPGQAAMAAGVLHPFERWTAELAELDRLIDGIPATDEAARDKVYDRFFEIERLIIATPCLDLPAIRAKAALVCWTMEMEGSDGLPAMRHIQAYLERTARNAA